MNRQEEMERDIDARIGRAVRDARRGRLDGAAYVVAPEGAYALIPVKEADGTLYDIRVPVTRYGDSA